MNLVKCLKRALGWGVGVLLGCVLAIGCSQDSEFQDEPVGLEAKKAEVQKLAEKYGVNFSFEDNISENEIDLKGIEEFFVFVKKVNSKRLSLVFIEEGKVGTPLVMNNNRLKTRSEEGNWTGYTDQGMWSLYVCVSWKKYNEDGQILHASVESHWGDFSIGTDMEYKQVEGDASFVDDYTISFSFTGVFTYHGKIRATVYPGGMVWIDKEMGYVY